MFTGIIEAVGEVAGIASEGTNLHIDVWSPFTSELQIDQSVAHNGACLTVVAIDGEIYRVTAIEETLHRTNVRQWTVGDRINLERALSGTQRMDGHMVQGHIDQTASCVSVDPRDGSWNVRFEFGKEGPRYLLVDKGSVAVDGVSLTVVRPDERGFGVSIIPYTFEQTLFGSYRPGSLVNIEFDVIGKYVHNYMQHYRAASGSR